MVPIMSLPSEVINIILCKENVSIKDIVSFACTCKRFNKIINDNVLWRKKFYQRWSFLREEYDELSWKENLDFLEQVKAGISFKKQLWHFMSLKSKQINNRCVDLKDLHSLFDPDNGAYFMKYYFFVNELKLLLQSKKNMTYTISNVPQRHFLKEFLLNLHFYHLRNKWHKFINYPEEQQILEEAAVILAQWYHFQSYVSYMYVKPSLDSIVQRVLEYLINKYPAHPISSISAEKFSFWKYNNIDDSHWNGIETRQILESLCKVLHNELGFQGIFGKCLGPEVIKNKFCFGLPLGIIYNSVARRLGVRCDLVSSPFRFLYWRKEYDIANLGDKHFYIDILCCDSSLTPSCSYDDMIINLTEIMPTVLRLLHNEFDGHKEIRLDEFAFYESVRVDLLPKSSW